MLLPANRHLSEVELVNSKPRAMQEEDAGQEERMSRDEVEAGHSGQRKG
jgi:hypothetical protein